MRTRKNKNKKENMVSSNGTIEIVEENDFFSSLKKYENEENVIVNYGNNKIKKIENLHLQKYKLVNLTLKECKFLNSSIKYSCICENSYLRHAKFENVDFTGTIFEKVNLEKAEFSNCDLRYVKFENCLLNYHNILLNKPKEHNLAISLIKSLYKNELQQGNSANADELYLLQKKEERLLYKKMLLSPNKNFTNNAKKTNYDDIHYYKKEMDRLALNKYKVSRLLLGSWLSYLVWGHGIKIGKIARFMIFMIIFFSFFYMLMLDKTFYDSILCSANAWVMNNEVTQSYCAKAIMLMENYLGLITLALFTSAFYRKVAK